MVVFFALHLGRIVTKRELLVFLREAGVDTPDPQPRHLGMQVGLNFLVQGCWHPRAKRALGRGEYCLLDLKTCHPNHQTMHRTSMLEKSDFLDIKAVYKHRCACCGSLEGEPHLKNELLMTTLERGHCDPRKPLDADNCIPMCTVCNRVYKNSAVFTKRGFVAEMFSKNVVDAETTRPPPPPPPPLESGSGKTPDVEDTKPEPEPEPTTNSSEVVRTFIYASWIRTWVEVVLLFVAWAGGVGFSRLSGVSIGE